MSIPRGWLLALLPIGLAGFLAGSTLHLVEYKPGADEGYYLRYSTRIAQEGPGVFPELFQEYLHGPPHNRLFPSPMRVTVLLLSSAVVRLGGPDYRALSLGSIAAFLALLALQFAGLRRVFGDRTAFWILLFLACSPLHLALARRALSDTLGSLLINGCLWGLWWALSGGPGRNLPGGRWWLVAALYAAAFLAKASTFVLIPISLFFLCWHRTAGPSRGPFPWKAAAAVSVVPLLITLGVLLWAAGGIGVLEQTVRFSRDAYESRFAAQYLQGPWFRYLLDYLLVSPWSLVIYLVWLGRLWVSPDRNEAAWFWALVPPLYLAGAAFFPLKDIRYLLALEMPVRMGAVLLVQRLVAGDRKDPWAAARMAAVLLPLLWLDLQQYRMFVLTDLYEPTSFYLLHLHHLLPR